MARVPDTWRQNLQKTGAIDEDQINELETLFNKLDANGDGAVDSAELGALFKSLGESVPAYKIREYVSKADTNKSGKIEMEEFLILFAKHQVDTGKDMTRQLAKQLQGAAVIQHRGAMEGAVHSYSEPEKRAFAQWINETFKNDPSMTHYLPIDLENEQLFQRVKDGVLLIKVINQSAPDTVDERVMNGRPKNEWQMRENHELALNSAASIGCTTVNLGAADMLAGTPHLVLGLLWQIIKIGLVCNINLQQHPELACLLDEDSGETMRDLLGLSPEELLIKWVNYHLKNAGVAKRIRNFTDDISDSEAYIWLLHQIAPAEDEAKMENPQRITSPSECLDQSDLHRRAEMVLETADVIGARAFVSPGDIVSGNYKLNLAFVANLYNTYPAFHSDKKTLAADLIIEETREEKTFRNWINSLGLKADGKSIPFVNHLYADLANGLVILTIEDTIKPGCVEWKKISKPPYNKLKAEILQRQNCKYAVDYATSPLKLKIVALGGDDIYDQNPTLTLGLVWQLMRAYTANILHSLSADAATQSDMDKYIVNWVQTTLSNAGKQSTVRDFKDKSLSNSLAVIDIIDAIKPKVVDYTLVNLSCTSDSDKYNNAKLAINWGRKIGARIYALPDDIVEVKPKMVMTVFACLMARSLQNK